MDTYFHIKKKNIFNKIANAKWIWGGQDPRPVNSYRLFRKDFCMDAFPEAAEITIYAESRYKLYINGEFIQMGPTPSQPEERLFENYSIKDYLTKGANCIGVEVYCPGLMTGQGTMVNPGVIAAVGIDYASIQVGTDFCNKEIGSGDGDMVVEDNVKMAVNTDYSWKTILADAWKPNTQLCPYAKGFYEYKDMSMYPSGWSEPGYDDSKWQDAIEMPFYSYSSEEKAFANYMGYPTLFKHKADKFLSCGAVSGVVDEEMKEKAAGLYKWVRNRWRKQMGNWPLGFDAPLPEGERFPEPVAELAAFEEKLDIEIQAEKNEEMLNSLPVTITVPVKGDPFLIFDFEIVQCGLISIDIESRSGGIADVAWDDREEFYRSAGNSDCHIHGAAPARDFLEYIAGIRIKAPFFKEVLIVPPENLKEIPDFKATVPTFYGNIEVNLVSDKNCKKYSYRVPDGCRCFVGNSASRGVLSPNAGEYIL